MLRSLMFLPVIQSAVLECVGFSLSVLKSNNVWASKSTEGVKVRRITGKFVNGVKKTEETFHLWLTQKLRQKVCSEVTLDATGPLASLCSSIFSFLCVSDGAATCPPSLCFQMKLQ